VLIKKVSWDGDGRLAKGLAKHCKNEKKEGRTGRGENLSRKLWKITFQIPIQTPSEEWKRQSKKKMRQNKRELAVGPIEPAGSNLKAG